MAPIGYRAAEVHSWATSTLEVIFKRTVYVEPDPIEIDEFYDPVRDQYHSTGILKNFILNSREPVDRVCFLARVDLYIPILTFVFGEAHLGGHHCIVSEHRLREDFYLRPFNESLETIRLLKEMVHELGHSYGLTHCINDLCVMHNSYNIADTDRKSHFPCSICFEALDRISRL